MYEPESDGSADDAATWIAMRDALDRMLDLYGNDWPTPEHAAACDEARAALASAGVTP